MSESLSRVRCRPAELTCLAAITASDSLFGGPNNDVLRGGNGDDALDGGDGEDECDGGQVTRAVTASPFTSVEQSLKTPGSHNSSLRSSSASGTDVAAAHVLLAES
jgi:RTX calcium-binding nonapeptide repeat (4 copies)